MMSLRETPSSQLMSWEGPFREGEVCHASHWVLKKIPMPQEVEASTEMWRSVGWPCEVGVWETWVWERVVLHHIRSEIRDL
jgi:hypothetical protein